jgi:hypothetical protein
MDSHGSRFDLTGGPATSKALSSSRSLRTSCDLCKQMKARMTSRIKYNTWLLTGNAQIKCQRKTEDEKCARCAARKLDCITTPVIRKKPKTKYVVQIGSHI